MRNTMAYKGYIARIEYDCRDEIFIGHVLDVDDRISFHGDTVAGLKASFHAAVEHYLKDRRTTTS